MTNDPNPTGPEPGADPIDVDALMADIRRRVAEKKARGLYGVDALAASSLDETEPLATEELERLRDLAVQRVDLTTTASTKPVLGPAVAQVKRRLTRASSQPLFTLAAQASNFNAGLLGYVARLGREATVLRRDLDEAREQASRAAELAETLAETLAATERRLAETERQVETLAGEGLHERLARLEHEAPPGERPAVAPIEADAGPSGILGLMIEARDWREEDAERWRSHLAGAEGPLLHVGCGSGRGLAALGEGATGVDDDPDLIAAGLREDRPVTCADPVEYAAALGPGSLGGAIVTGLVERLDPARAGALMAALARALRDGAPLVVEGIDPSEIETLAGEVWRDPRRTRPLHADAVVALVEAAGLGVSSVDPIAVPDAPARYAVHAVA